MAIALLVLMLNSQELGMSLISMDHYPQLICKNETELLDILANHINQHVKGWRGSIHQEPYKGDFLVIFKALHFRKKKARDFSDIHIKIKNKLLKNEQTEEVINNLRPLWNEWCYCWRYIGH